MEEILNQPNQTKLKEPKKPKKPREPKKPKEPKQESDPCERCKFRCEHQPVHGIGVTGKLMFVGICPGEEEVKKGKPFVGGSGKYFRQVAKDVGIDLDTEAYLTNLLRCPATTATPKEAKPCGEKLLEEIRQVDPKYIVLMGEPPLKFFFAKQLSQYRGMVLSKGDRKFFITYNPAHLSREKEDSQDRKFFEQDLRRLYSMYLGVPVERNGIVKFLCRTEEDVVKSISELMTVDDFVMDIESYAPGKLKDKATLDPWAEGFRITSISFGYYYGKLKKAFCIPLEHPDNEMDVAVLYELLQVFFRQSKQGIIGQNIKWDIKCLEVHCNVRVNSVIFDTLSAHTLLSKKRGKGTHTLERMSVDYLNVNPYKEILRSEKEFTIASIEQLSEMNMDDCINTLELATIFEQDLKEVDGLWEYYKTVIIPAIKPLKNMEVHGMLVDMPYLTKLEDDTRKSIDQLHEKLMSYSELVGKDLKISSNKDLNTILYDIFQFPTPERKTTLGFAVDKPVFEALQKQTNHPFLTDLLELKGLQKLHSTYILPYLRKKLGQNKWGEVGTGHVKSDGRVHGQFNQHVAVTGRLSMENPNLQNLPVKSGSTIMRMFIAPPGYKLVVADYNQMELRILAARSGDAKLIQTFKEGTKDIHRMTASEVFHVPYDEVTSQQRRDAKSVNFGIVYGITEVGLAVQIGCTEEVAKEIIKNYLAQFPGVQQYMKEMKTMMYKKGYVLTMFKRRIYITGKDKNGRERKAINGPIQGTASDVNQVALIKFANLLENCNAARVFPNNVIHDSQVLEVHEDEVEIISSAIKQTMETLTLPFDMRGVALKADVGVGDNFAEAK